MAITALKYSAMIDGWSNLLILTTNNKRQSACLTCMHVWLMDNRACVKGIVILMCASTVQVPIVEENIMSVKGTQQHQHLLFINKII